MEGRSRTRLDELLDDFDRRKQQETRALVEKAKKLEANRKEGAELLRRFALSYLRGAAARIEEAGHEVVLDEMLDAYPPGLRLHLWVKPGPLDDPEVRPRFSLEFVWGDPNPGLLCVKRWSSDGLDQLTHQGQCRPAVLDSTWVREQIHLFLGHALST